MPISEQAHTLADGVLGYKYEITNKYYTVSVYLCPLSGGEQALKNFPLLSKAEGFLIHLDAADKSLLNTILPKYVAIADDLEPECKILLCDKLFDEDKDGITYAQLKQQCTLWDVIELSKEVTEDEVDALNPVGYDELRDALQNIIWSNVEYSGNGKMQWTGHS